MGWFDWFDDERVVQVGGGVSRIREDAFIKNTTGLVVNSALINNQDLNQAILLNEITGTVSSFKQFNRVAKASSTIRVPTTSFVYSTIDKNQLAAAIRSNISKSYPIAANIADSDVSSGSLTSADHSKYALQENKSYNLTTNVFTHLGVDYNFVSYVDQFSGSTHIGYTINGTKVTAPFTPIAFTLAVPKPAGTILVPATDEFGFPTIVELPREYWTVFYFHAGRRYIWIADLTLSIFSESSLTVNPTTNPELEFAPIIPIRNDKVNVNSGTAFTQATKALKLLGLEPNAINAQITDPAVEDVYVTLFSNLLTPHIDQLAYNYAFFEYMDQFGVVDESSFNSANAGLLAGSSVYKFNKLSIAKTGVYDNNTSWGYIKKTTGIVGVLGADYTYTLTDPGITQWILGVPVGDYTIRKRTGAITYDEILVKNLALSYTVFASAGDVMAFSVPVTVDSGAQLVIPFSYKIALNLPGKYRETLFLRCVHVGLFSKTVQEIPWYKQAWFADLLLIAIIVYAVYSGNLQLLIEAIEVEAVVAELLLEISFEAALILVIAKYTITQIVLKIILTKILASSGNNSVFKLLAVVAYVYISIQMAGGDSLSTVKQALIGGKAVLESNNILLQSNLQKEYAAFGKELETYKGIQEKIDPLMEQFKAIEASQANATQALDILNMFKEAGENFVLPSDIDAYDQQASIQDQTDMISLFVSNALKLIDPPTLILESETLLT
jgi:hypothetical protein